MKGTDINMKQKNQAFLDSIEQKAAAMQKAVLNAESEYTLGKNGKIYYISAEGSDSNEGLSEDTPIASLDRLAKLPLQAGDVILLRRGDMFRGRVQAVEGVTYSAYGTGAKPILNASTRNYAETNLWQATEYPNVWVCMAPLKNVGIVALDHTGEIGKYDEIVGTRMVQGQDGFTGISDLIEDLQVWYDLECEKLYFCSMEGNPGERFSDIEIGEVGNAITIGNSRDVTVDNLHVTLTGSHGVGASTTENLTVRNCLFNWLGGSILMGFEDANITGYGNAVEVFGGVRGYHVYNNWIYQIYDTGITHQYNDANAKVATLMENIEYKDNLIEYCFWSIEYYNYGSKEFINETKNVHVHDNICRMGGYGWGCAGRSSSAPMYSIGSCYEYMENYVTENNIFDRCLGYLVFVQKDCVAVFRNNTYIQPRGENFLLFVDNVYRFDENAAERLIEIGETNPELVYLMIER